jgi:hypothetical protein
VVGFEVASAKGVSLYAEMDFMLCSCVANTFGDSGLFEIEAWIRAGYNNTDYEKFVNKRIPS